MTGPRRGRRLAAVGRATVVALVLALASAGRVAAHAAPHSAGRRGAALGLFVLGSVMLAGSLYLDRATDGEEVADRPSGDGAASRGTDVARTWVDLGVLAGVLALGASVVLFW